MYELRECAKRKRNLIHTRFHVSMLCRIADGGLMIVVRVRKTVMRRSSSSSLLLDVKLVSHIYTTYDKATNADKNTFAILKHSPFAYKKKM